MDRIDLVDANQTKLIEAIHRGFLYQHLYGVGILLLAQSDSVQFLHCERDEDLEVLGRGTWDYVQVKTRSASLAKDDIIGTIEKFKKIEALHASGERAGVARLWIVSNSAPNGPLSTATESEWWPARATLLWPADHSQRPDFLPPVWIGTREAFDWCVGIAKNIPHRAISASTLVYKLAAMVLHACTGDDSRLHKFSTSELPTLFEQIRIQLQHFPDTPTPYLLQDEEPSFISDKHARLIVGVPGSGKTAWATMSAASVSEPVVYFDAAGTSPDSIVNQIVRETAATLFANNSEGLQAAFAPGIVGLDGLRSIDSELEKRQLRGVVVMDNAHNVLPEMLVLILNAARRVQWILLSHPTERTLEIEMRLGVKSEPLKGWTTDTVGLYLRGHGCVADYQTAERTRDLTAGFPLYVKGLSEIAATNHSGNMSQLCDELDALEHDTASPLELVLSTTCQSASRDAIMLMALLSFSTVPLGKDEIGSIAACVKMTRPETTTAIRELIAMGIIQRSASGTTLHDAFRLLARQKATELSPENVSAIRHGLIECVERSISETADYARQVLFLRLLPLVGRTNELLDLASSGAEVWLQLGFAKAFQDAISLAVNSDEIPAYDRFWGRDVLAFWALERDDVDNAREHIEAMDALLLRFQPRLKDWLAIRLKKLMLTAKLGDIAKARRIFDAIMEERLDERQRLILQHDFCVCLFKSGQYQEAADGALTNVFKYYDLLEIDAQDTFFKNAPEIWEKLPRTPYVQEDLRHLADSLDLYAMAQKRIGKPAGLARLHAFKFYGMSMAARSVFRVGQDVIDDLLDLGDADQARQIIEGSLLPNLNKFGDSERVIPIRAQYAVVMAYCGDADGARKEMSAIKAFAARNDEAARELANQEALIEAILRGEVTLPSPAPSLPAVALSRHPSRKGRKIGRNEPCPCNSGKKYKKCCGAS